ncbi:conserved hypothetical protein [Theileria orientalis strain Shintoku]|uniref:Uncharacterized protein n=1 Tax=Theileria orientalis strain Shintoku TaxID=869250 RepID=J4C956_THEOR|nr:conserved hypothetical protein [Theileria orientalis strain Shintoku]BAM41953.1 conserved hypothetical protein [Theileria orientalis strain Shintoku]|eukprot:XP_009692254.1 conserved hypothetical protein [Theileria orientalis strain Shintoku]
MYYYSNKLIPNVEFLGNVCNNFIYRNYRFYSTFLYNSYINKIKCRLYKSQHHYNNKLSPRKLNTWNNNSLNDVTVNRDTNSPNNSSYNELCNHSNSYRDSYERENTNKQLGDIDKVLAMIKTGNVKEIDEYMFESIDKNILTNLDKFTISDINNLLHTSLKVFYSQNLIEALILKLKCTHPSEIPLATLALVFQSLGRVLPCDFHIERIEKFLQETCDHILNVDVLAESHFSSIVYGFQRLHYNNHDFLRKIVKRYEENMTNFNVNSVTISISSLVKLNYYNVNIIMRIYKHIYKSMSHMNLQTSIQLSTTIYKVHEHYFKDSMQRSGKAEEDEEVVDGKMKESLNKISYRLLNNILKNVCEQHLKELSLFQICLLLDSINRMNYRKITYLSKLIQCIPSHGSNMINPTSIVQRNLYSYMEMPECPFNYNMTLKKLQSVDPCHLILISHSIFGLDYYNEYTLNLLLVIKEIVNPILHELKARHILLYTLSYINIYFTNYQLQRIQLGSASKTVSRNYVKLILKSLESDSLKTNWFNKKHLINSGTEGNEEGGEDDTDEDAKLLKQLRDRISACEWKEELVLSSFESLLRHYNYVKSSQSMLSLFKLLFLSLIHDVYIPSYTQYFNLATLNNPDESKAVEILNAFDTDAIAEGATTSDVGAREGKVNVVMDGEVGKNRIPAIMPENIIEKLYELYKSPTTEDEKIIRLDGRCMCVDRRIQCFKVDIVIYNV